MNCPKCKSAVTAAPDASGLIICAKCGARLRSRASAEKAAPASPRVGSDTLPAVARSGSETLPPGKIKRPEAPEDEDPTGKVAVIRAKAVAEAPFPPDDPPAAAEPPPPAATSPAAPALAVPPGMEPLFDELRAIRAGQEEILGLLRTRLGSASPAAAEDDEPPPLADETALPMGPIVRSRRRKSVLIIDDDPGTRIAALQAFELAEVPTRTAQDGNAGLAAIAQEKPDVIVLELGVGGDMSGKDVVNMIKATMEWVDVPIVLYTRMPIESQKEARIIHGADELVPKGPDGPNQLVARVIGIFRKG